MVKHIFGTEVSFQYIYIAVLTFVLIMDKSGGIFCCFLSSLLHEIGHLIPLVLFHQKIDKIEFSVFDVKIKSQYRLSFSKELTIVLSGVGFNFLLFGVFIKIIPIFAYTNLFIGLFNILPVSTLDGGQALKIILNKFFTQHITEIVINILTVIFAMPIFTLGIIVLINTGYNFSFLFLGIYLILTVVYNKRVFQR